MSLTKFRPRKQTLRMSQRKRDSTPKEYRDKFLRRVKQAREAIIDSATGRKLSQRKMAAMLGLEQDHYKQYESRSMMPLYILVQFCEHTGQHPWYMLTGQSASSAPGTVHTQQSHTASVRPIRPSKPKVRA